METMLTVMGGALGVIVPVLFVWMLNKGIHHTTLDEQKKKRLRRQVILVVTFWVVTVWVLALLNVLTYHQGDQVPRFVLALVVPVVIGGWLLTRNGFRNILDNIPLKVIVAVQAFRFAGFAFFIVAGLDMLPGFFNSAGYGDIITGALAISAALSISENHRNANFLFWAFNFAGLFDLLNVAVMLLYYYPIWYTGSPSSVAATSFSLVMIPAIAAPIALLLHIFAIRNFFRTEARSVQPERQDNF